MVNVIPLNDEAPHRHSPNCWCGPVVDMWEEPNGPRVIHNSADCREAVERLLGEGMGPGMRFAERDNTDNIFTGKFYPDVPIAGATTGTETGSIIDEKTFDYERNRGMPAPSSGSVKARPVVSGEFPFFGENGFLELASRGEKSF